MNCPFCNEICEKSSGVSFCLNEHPRFRIIDECWATIGPLQKNKNGLDPSYPLVMWKSPDYRSIEFNKKINSHNGTFSYIPLKNAEEIIVSEGKFNFTSLKELYDKVMKFKAFL